MCKYPLYKGFLQYNANKIPSYPNKIPIKTNKFLENTNKISVQTNKILVTSSYPLYKFPCRLFLGKFSVFLGVIVSQRKQQSYIFFKQSKQNPVRFVLTSYNPNLHYPSINERQTKSRLVYRCQNRLQGKCLDLFRDNERTF